MKIVKVDNFDRETHDDFLVATVPSGLWAERIKDLLNERYSGDHSDAFFEVYADDKPLRTFQP